MALAVLTDLAQGTDEWLAARCGMVTASVAGRLLTSTLQVADNATSRGLTLLLAAERITGRVDPDYISADMWRGITDEPVARDAYAEHYAPVHEVGLMIRDDWGYRIGYSPDGLVGDHGQIEIKSRSQKAHLATILGERIPADCMAQVQCGLLVSGRAWCDYISYRDGMPLWVKRVTPDPEWHAAIVAAVAQLESSAADMTDRYRTLAAHYPMTDRTADLLEIEI